MSVLAVHQSTGKSKGHPCMGLHHFQMLGAGEQVQLDAVGVLQGASVQGPAQGASEKAASVQAATQDQSCRLQTHDQRGKEKLT